MRTAIKVLKEALKIVLAFAIMFCMGMSIIFPFMINMKDTPWWLAWVIYPVTVLSIAYINVVGFPEDKKEK